MIASTSTNRRLGAAAALAAAPFRHRAVAAGIVGALARGRFGDARRMARTASKRPDRGAEKIVSRKFGCLWMCNPKAASRSIMSALLRLDPDAEVIDGRTVADVYAMRPEARDYYSFAFIRHPFDRTLSLYAEMRFFRERYAGMHRVLKARRQRYFDDSFFGLAEVDSFDDYCAWLNTPWGSDAFANGHFLSQNVQIRLEDGRLPDFVGRLENIEEDWRRVASRLAVAAPELPTLNTMAGWRAPSRPALEAARTEMRVLLTERNEALLRRRYAADLELYARIAKGEAEARGAAAAPEARTGVDSGRGGAGRPGRGRR